MNIKSFLPKGELIMPNKGRQGDAGWDIYMPQAGSVNQEVQFFPLGFATEIPPGWCAIIMPRSGVGAKYGLEMNNTIGLIDSNYRGEWIAALKTKSDKPFSWGKGERVLQFIIVPHYDAELKLVDELGSTKRGEGKYGSSGK